MAKIWRIVMLLLLAVSPAAAIERAAQTKEDAVALQSFMDERDRRYMELFKSLTDLVNQRFSDQAVAVAAAFAANEKAIQAAFASNEKATAAALAAAKEAVAKAEAATESRFASVNEFRAQLKDQASTLMPREEFTTQRRQTDDRISRIETSQAQMTGGILLIVAIIPIAAGIVVWFLRKQPADK